MKALTVWQPWASLIVAGVKPYEFRGHKAPAALVGQRIAIHAGVRPPRRFEINALLMLLNDPAEAWQTGLTPDAIPLLEMWLADTSRLWLGHVVGTAILGTPRDAAEIAAEFGGPVNDSDREEHARFAWPMRDPEPYSPPIEARGAQGFWNWSRLNAA